MEGTVPLFPEQASTVAVELDRLYLAMVGVALFFTALICILVLVFIVRYRANSRANRSHPPTSLLSLELVWSIVPLALMLISFTWGARLFIDRFKIPDDAIQVDVVGKQWMWRIRHRDGPREINELHVPLGQPVCLTMISEDVIHSFFVPAFRVKQDVLPGRYTQLWFEATKAGEYHLFCAEYCGTSHAQMRGRVIVQTPQAYSEWLAADRSPAPSTAGHELLARHRCQDCHDLYAPRRGPALAGVLGRTVVLRNGETRAADAAYVREAILDPSAAVVAGFEPIMPTFKGQISEEEVLEIIAYLGSLSPAGGAAPGADGRMAQALSHEP